MTTPNQSPPHSNCSCPLCLPEKYAINAALQSAEFPLKCGHHQSLKQVIGNEEYCELCYRFDCWQKAEAKIRELTEKLTEVQGERDRQYEFNAGMIVKETQLSQVNEKLVELLKSYREDHALEEGCNDELLGGNGPGSRDKRCPDCKTADEILTKVKESEHK